MRHSRTPAEMFERNRFEAKLTDHGLESLRPQALDVLQINVGLRCNMACNHCHVLSSAQRTEEIDWPTLERVVAVTRELEPRLVDLTGGAPEMNPHLRRFVSALRGELPNLEIQVRTNLTVHLEPGFEWAPAFFRAHEVALVASLPCYLEENVRQQRGRGAYEKSLQALRNLNQLGYGREERLRLDLVYNPVGPVLPPDQSSLEASYRDYLREHFDIEFSRLAVLTNMPVGRFSACLSRKNQYSEYLGLLEAAFNPATLPHLMCRRQIEVGWDGSLYDCDFHLAHRTRVDRDAPQNIRDFDLDRLRGRRIITRDYCLGCTAGSGSSCGGALLSAT